MSVMRRFADRVLARLVPEVPASACKEYTYCEETGGPGSDNWYRCYAGCGRPTFCVLIGSCEA
jgi:hypothetical protein